MIEASPLSSLLSPPYQMKRVMRSAEMRQTDTQGHQIADEGCPRRTGNTHIEELDEHDVEHKVQDRADHHRCGNQTRVAVGLDKILHRKSYQRERDSQHDRPEEIQRQRIDAAVNRTDETGDLFCHQVTDSRQQDADTKSGCDRCGKHPVGCSHIALPHRFGCYDRPSYTKQESQTGAQRQDG